MIFIFFAESEGRSGTLDTLPEEKTTKTNEVTEYKRVYPDWKPTIDKTDVVGAMEAIEGKSDKEIICYYIKLSIHLIFLK